MQKLAIKPAVILGTLLVIGILGLIYGPSLLRNATQSRAAIDARLQFSPTSVANPNVGANLPPISINVDTGVSNNPVRGVDVSVTFSSNVLELIDINPSAQTTTSLQTFAPVTTTDTFHEQLVIDCANGTGDATRRAECTDRGMATAGKIEFGAVTFNIGTGNTTPAQMTDFILAALTFRGKAAGSGTIAFNYTAGSTTDSNVVSVDASQNSIDVLGEINGPISITVNNTGPTVTVSPLPPTVTLTPTRTPTPSATRTPTPSLTRTPTPSPTNPVTACVCATNNICSTTAAGGTACSGFLQPNGTAHIGSVVCSYDAEATIYASTPTQTNKDAWCARPRRTAGDANGDNIADPRGLDYFYWLRGVLGATLPTSVNPDFNGNGDVSSTDRVLLNRNLTPTP